MTIAISLKVHDGVVMAADSASTLMGRGPDGQAAVINVYNNANKIVNLYKGLPLGVTFWGAGAIGPASVTTVCKDLRDMLSGREPGADGSDWKLNPDTYTVADVAERLRQYVVDHLLADTEEPRPADYELGMIVAGFSAHTPHAEEYRLFIHGTGAEGPELLREPDVTGWTMGGQPEHIDRLVNGVDQRIVHILQETFGMSATDAPQAAEVIRQQLAYPLIEAAMPLQDALDLAEFLVDTTIKTVKFLPGAGTVGGAIELAAITKHEGFKWVRRKHYFDAELNDTREHR